MARASRLVAGLAAAGSPWHGRWLALADNVRGALWVVASCLFISAMAALVKLAGGRLDSFQLAFLRAAFGFLIVLPLALAGGRDVLRTGRLGLHAARGLAGSVGMMCGFYALTRMPLAEVTAIGFTAPLFLVILAALVLGERVRARRWSATMIGFAGVLIMLRPGEGVVQIAALVALLGAFAAANVKLLVKRLATTEAPLTIIVYFGLVSSLATALPAALVWQPPSAFELALLLAAALCSSLAQLCFIRGYGLGEASALAPFEYARLPFAALFGFALFAELPDAYSLAGAALIVASTLYIARREARLGKPLAVPRATTES